MEPGDEVERTRIMPVRSSTYAFSLSIRSINGLYFRVLSTTEDREDGDTGDRGMSRPNIGVRGGNREQNTFAGIPKDDMIGWVVSGYSSLRFGGGGGGWSK